MIRNEKVCFFNMFKIENFLEETSLSFYRLSRKTIHHFINFILNTKFYKFEGKSSSSS